MSFFSHRIVIVDFVAGQWGQLRMMTANEISTSEAMRRAESAVRAILEAGTPGDQMEGLMRAYNLSSDCPAFAAVLIGNLVSARALAASL